MESRDLHDPLRRIATFPPMDQESVGGPTRDLGRSHTDLGPTTVAHARAAGSPVPSLSGSRANPGRAGRVQRVATGRSAAIANQGHRLRPAATACAWKG